MSIKVYPLLDKIDAMAVEIEESRKARRAPGSAEHRHYEILKAISADLRGRQQLPRNNTLGEIERALDQLKQSRTPEGYDTGQMIRFANLLVNKWPTISQALEHFGEESAE